MTALCPNCDFHNPPGMRFCGNCGSRLPESPPPESAPAAPGFLPERLGAMVGADLLERFRQAGLEAAGQRRNVTVLFVDLASYTALSQRLDNEDTYDLIQQYIGLLAGSVYKYEGMVDKFTGDGLMALFGAPIAQEMHAEMAVRAALDMQADVARLSQQITARLGAELQVHIGLHAGSVVVGSVGSNLLMNYTAIGDTVNLAARLMQATSDGILVSESVYRQTEAWFDYAPLPPLALKGFAYPVAAYRCLGAKARPGSVRGLRGMHAPLIGREAELNQLQRAAHALTSRRRLQFILVTGEAGIGKSRLIAEFKETLAPEAVAALEGRSLTYRRTVSYWIFLDLLRGYLGVASGVSEVETLARLSQKVTAVLGAHAAEVLPYLEHLLATQPSAAASERVRYLDAAQLRQQIFLAVRDVLIVEAQRRPLLLVLDDLHWADDVSLDLLQYLLGALQALPVLVIAISRPVHEGPMRKIVEWAEKHLAGRSTAIHLQSLSTPQSEQLLYRLLTVADLPDHLRDQILQRAAGVPFYLEEILRMLMDHHLLEREDGHWRVRPDADLTTLGVPDTLQGLILARFDRLDPTERRVLQAASAIGRNFDARLLDAVLRSGDERPLEAVLARLAERMFIAPQPGAGEPEYQFNHVLVSDTIYSTLLKRDRSELHGQIGEAMETVYADRLEEHVELLARHYAWSSRLDRALHYLILAGQRAAQVYATEQARQHYQEALARLPNVAHGPMQALQVHQGLGDLLTLTGDYQAARQHYEAALQAMAGANEALRAQERGVLYRSLGQTYERQGDYAAALAQLALAESALEETTPPAPVERARVLHDVGWIHFRRGDLEAAEQNLLQALALVEGSSHHDVIASIYNRLGGVYYQKKELDKTSDYLHKSLVLREEIGDILGAARSYNNRGLIAYQRGDWEGALENYKKNLELQKRIGDAEALALSHLNIAILQMDCGDFAEAQASLEQSLEAAQKTGALFHIASAHMHLGRLHLSQASYAPASEHLEKSQQLFEEIGARENLVDVYHLLGEAQLGLGQSVRAADWAQRSLDLVSSLRTQPLGQSDQRGRAVRLLAKVKIAEKQWEAAAQYLRDSADIFRATGSRLEEGRTLVEYGRLNAAQDDRAAARADWEGAQQIFRELKAQAEEQAVAELLSRAAHI